MECLSARVRAAVDLNRRVELLLRCAIDGKHVSLESFSGAMASLHAIMIGTIGGSMSEL